MASDLDDDDWDDDDWDDPEGWSDVEGAADDDSDEELFVPCPECGKLVYTDTEMCPACGYWLTAADRGRLDGSPAKRTWVKAVALALVIALLLALLSGVF